MKQKKAMNWRVMHTHELKLLQEEVPETLRLQRGALVPGESAEAPALANSWRGGSSLPLLLSKPFLLAPFSHHGHGLRSHQDLCSTWAQVLLLGTADFKPRAKESLLSVPISSLIASLEQHLQLGGRGTGQSTRVGGTWEVWIGRAK